MRHDLRLFSCTSLGNLLPNHSLRYSWLLLICLWETTKNRFTKKAKSSNCFLCTCESGPPWKHPLIFIWLQKMSTKIPPKIDHLWYTQKINVKRISNLGCWSNSSKTSNPSARGLHLGQTPLSGQCPAAHFPSLQAGFIWDGQTHKIPPMFAGETPDWMNLNEAFQTCFGV